MWWLLIREKLILRRILSPLCTLTILIQLQKQRELFQLRTLPPSWSLIIGLSIRARMRIPLLCLMNILITGLNLVKGSCKEDKYKSSLCISVLNMLNLIMSLLTWSWKISPFNQSEIHLMDSNSLQLLMLLSQEYQCLPMWAVILSFWVFPCFNSIWEDRGILVKLKSIHPLCSLKETASSIILIPRRSVWRRFMMGQSSTSWD